MAQTLMRLLPVEMALLGLTEFCLLFALIFAMLTFGDPSSLGPALELPSDCLILAAMLAVTVVGTAATIGMYRPDVCLDRRRFLATGTVTALLAFPALLLVTDAYSKALTTDHVFWLARLLAVWLVILITIRFAFSALTARFPVVRRVVVIGAADQAAAFGDKLARKRPGLFQVTLNPSDAPAAGMDDDAAWDRVWAVVIAGDGGTPAVSDVPHSDAAMARVAGRHLPIMTERAFQERHLGRIEPMAALDIAALTPVQGAWSRWCSNAVKRGFDIAVAITLIIVTLPLMIVTAILIRLDSPGPIFYRQERTGLNGQTFTLFKFRSMTADAETPGQPQWAQRKDPRVTRVGAFIRTSRIDELPQLINVLRGEMSMIGPRPERPLFVAQLARVIPHYDHRATVKPGLTGWAQVSYPYGASVEDAWEKLAYDLYYVKNKGILLDLVILLATVRVILFREGAR